MDEKTKTIIDRARALLAAATQGPVAVYPHPRPRQDHDESRFQWGDLVTGGRSMWTMIPMADAEALAFAVNNLGAICDALEAAERRAEEAEAQAAAMRFVLARVRVLPGVRSECESALDANAGRALLDRLHAAEAKVARMEARKAAICGCVSCCSGHVAPDIEDACPDCHGSGAVIVEGGE